MIEAPPSPSDLDLPTQRKLKAMLRSLDADLFPGTDAHKLDHLSDEETMVKILEFSYLKLRMGARYPYKEIDDRAFAICKTREEREELGKKDQKLQHHAALACAENEKEGILIRDERGEREWLYRGIFEHQGSEKTVARGSLNVYLCPEVVDRLDQLIIEGSIVANYKLAQGVDRVDSVTIYFLVPPDEKAIIKIGRIANQFFRGNDLTGKKRSRGFYMSEIGSIQEDHVIGLMKILNKSPSIHNAITTFLRKENDPRDPLKISEGGFYVLKDFLDMLGYVLSYDLTSGFEVKKQ